MNKNEFYKQLMSEYSFDADKIRANAKRGKSARQKLQPMYVGMTAAAAALVVTVGTLAAVNLTKNNGVSLTDSGLATLSANDRVIHAIEQLEKERGSEESKDFLVNFTASMSPAEVQAVLTRYVDGSMPVKMLYFADGTRMNSTDSIGEVFTSGADYKITAAAVYCTGDIATKLQSDPAVFLIESMTESDYESVTPVNIGDVDTTEVTLPDNSNVVIPPEKPDNSIIAEPGGNDTSEGLDGTVEPEATEEMDGTSEPGTSVATAEVVTEDAGGSEDNSTVTNEVPEETTRPSETETPSTSTGSEEADQTIPSESTHPAEALPAGVELPQNVPATNYTAYVEADTAFFLTEDTFFVRNRSGVSLYRYADGSETLICSESIDEPKIVWVAENGGKLIVSGISEFGTRGRLLCVDAESGDITDLHAEDMVMSGVLQSASYNADSQLLVMNVREDGMYYIITAFCDLSDSDYIATPYESSNKITIAAANAGVVYFTETYGGSTKLMSVDKNGNVANLHDFGNNVSVSRNLAFTHAVFTPETGSVIGFTEVFDPAAGKLIQLNDSDTGSVYFGSSKHSFSCDGSVYTVSGGEVISSGGLSTTAAIDYRKSFSEKYSAAASNGYVKITDSIYTAANKSSLMTFSEITENSSADLRRAVDQAIGLNNAIALGQCRQSGITTPETLVDCIKYCYTDKAVDELINRCGISTLGALHYSDGGLTPINGTDTTLVISSENSDSASGMLYIKAGSYAGKTAYRSVGVSFSKVNGSWKLDSVI